LIVPVPLHKSRKCWRGFNQAEEIAKKISKEIKIPIVSENLFRVKKTFPQVEMNDHQKRLENITGAFNIKNLKVFQDKKIILVDDVYTSGATMEECAKVLRNAGAKEIWGIVVAK
jgi:ComF family protein